MFPVFTARDIIEESLISNCVQYQKWSYKRFYLE